MVLLKQLHAGIIDVPEYGVRGKRGDFKPTVSGDLFHRAAGRAVGPHPEHGAKAAEPSRLPASQLRALRGMRTRHHRKLVEGPERLLAYYHCRPGYRGVNAAKAKLESQFTGRSEGERCAPGRPAAASPEPIKAGKPPA